MSPTYIYFINNINNNPNLGYVGKTVNFKARKYDHFKTYGKDINLTIIDETLSNWKFWERYWINQFKSWGFELLNKNKGGGGPQFRKPENLQIIVDKLKKPIKQFDKNFNLVKEWSSIKEAKQEIGGNIDTCLKGEYKTSSGFYWKYSNDLSPNFNTSKRKGKKVLQYSLDGNLLNMYNSTQEAEKLFNNLGKDNIGACCRGKQKSSYGYVWKYKNDI